MSWGLLLVAGCAAPPLHAASVEVRVTSQGGNALSDAAVSLAPVGWLVEAAPSPQSHVVDQVDETFVPLLQVFRPGDSVVFRNSDDTRHHAYSFAPVRPFELELLPGETAAPIELPAAGLVAVGCNIHDRMITYLYVADAPFAARSGEDGTLRFDGIPAGEYLLTAWHPWLRDRDAPARVRVHAQEEAAATVPVALDVRPERRLADPERVDY